MYINVHPKKVVFWLGVVIAMLFLADIAVLFMTSIGGHDYVYGLVPLFDVDSEQNIPTFFSAVLILICALVLAIIAAIGKKQNQRDYAYWLGLSLVFIFMAVDEAASIHELLIDPFHNNLHTSGIFTFAWVIPYGLLLLVFCVSYIRFLFRLPAQTRNRMIVAGMVYVAGAMGLELVGGWYFDHHAGVVTLVYRMITLCEEMLEMSGMVIFLYALMMHIQTDMDAFSLRIADYDELDENQG